MSLMPFVKRCPCCRAVNLVTDNNDQFIELNQFKNLKDWKFKKKINCRKCKEQLGLFVDESNKLTQLYWLSSLKCDEIYYDKLNKLNNIKTKLSKHPNKKYYEILKEIQNINNKIRMDKIKLKIKFKIQNKGLQDQQYN